MEDRYDPRVIEACWMRPVRPRRQEAWAWISQFVAGRLGFARDHQESAKLAWDHLAPPLDDGGEGYGRWFESRGVAVRVGEARAGRYEVQTVVGETVFTTAPRLGEHVRLGHPLTLADVAAFAGDPVGMRVAEKLALLWLLDTSTPYTRPGRSVVWRTVAGRGTEHHWRSQLEALPFDRAGRRQKIIALGYALMPGGDGGAVLLAPEWSSTC